MESFLFPPKFIDGYTIKCEREWFKEGWERWCEEKYNIINEKHIKQLDRDYEEIKLLSSQSGHYYKIKSGNNIGLLSSSLQEILPVEYYSIEVDENSDIIRAVKGGGKLNGYRVEYVNAEGKVLRSIICMQNIYEHPIYIDDKRLRKDLFPPFLEKYCIVVDNSKKGIIDNEGKYIVPPNYENLQIVDEIKVIACLSSKYGLINFNETIILDFIYNRIEYIEPNFFIVRKGKLEGIINLLCPEKLKLKKIKYHTFSDGYIIASRQTSMKEEKFGVEDYNGNVIIPFKYDNLSKFENGIAVATMMNKHGLINIKNQFVQPLRQGSIKRIDEGYYLTNWQNKFGLLNPDGSMLLQPFYSKIEFKHSCFEVEDGHLYNYLEFNGEFRYEDWEQYYDDSDDSYTQKELNDMYRDAFDGFPDAVWNVD